MTALYCSTGDIDLKHAHILGPSTNCIFSRLSEIAVVYLTADSTTHGVIIPAQTCLLWQDTFENSTGPNQSVVLNNFTTRYVVLFIDPLTQGDPNNIILFAVPEQNYTIMSQANDVIPLYYLVHRDWVGFQIRNTPKKFQYVFASNISGWDSPEFLPFHFNPDGRSNFNVATQGLHAYTTSIDISPSGILASDNLPFQTLYKKFAQVYPPPPVVTIEHPGILNPIIFTAGLTQNRIGVYNSDAYILEEGANFGLTLSTPVQNLLLAQGTGWADPPLDFAENTIAISVNQNGMWFLNQAFKYITIAMNFYVVDQITYVAFAQLVTSTAGDTNYILPANYTYLVSKGYGGTGLFTPLYPKSNTLYDISGEQQNLWLYNERSGEAIPSKDSWEGYAEGFVTDGSLANLTSSRIGVRYPGATDYGLGGILPETDFTSPGVLDSLLSPQKFLFTGGHYPYLVPPTNLLYDETGVYGDITQDSYTINPNGLLQADKLWVDYADYYVSTINTQVPAEGELGRGEDGHLNGLPVNLSFTGQTFFAEFSQFWWYPGAVVFQLAFNETGTASGINLLGAIYARFSDGSVKKFGIESNTLYITAIDVTTDSEIIWNNLPDGNPNNSYQQYTTYIPFPVSLAEASVPYNFTLYVNEDGTLTIGSGSIAVFTGIVNPREAKWTFMDDKAGYCSDIPRAYPCKPDGTQFELLTTAITGPGQILQINSIGLEATGNSQIAIATLFNTYSGGWIPGNDGDFYDPNNTGQRTLTGGDYVRPQYPRPGTYGMDLGGIPINTAGAPDSYWPYRATEGWGAIQFSTRTSGMTDGGFLLLDGFHIYFRYFSRDTLNQYQIHTTTKTIELPDAGTPVKVDSNIYPNAYILGIPDTYTSSAGGFFRQGFFPRGDNGDWDFNDSVVVRLPDNSIMDPSLPMLVMPGTFPGTFWTSPGYPQKSTPSHTSDPETNGGVGCPNPLTAYQGTATYTLPVSSEDAIVPIDGPNGLFTAMVAKFDIIASTTTGQPVRWWRVDTLQDFKGIVHNLGEWIAPTNGQGYVKGPIYNWATNTVQEWSDRIAVNGNAPAKGLSLAALTNYQVPNQYDTGLPLWIGPFPQDLPSIMGPFLGGSLYGSNYTALTSYEAYRLGLPDHYYSVPAIPAYAMRWFVSPSLTMTPVVDNYLAPPDTTALGIGPAGSVIILRNYSATMDQNYGSATAEAVQLEWIYLRMSDMSEHVLDNSGNQLSKAGFVVNPFGQPNFSSYPLARHPGKDSFASPYDSTSLNSHANRPYSSGWVDATGSIINGYLPVRFSGNNIKDCVTIGTGQLSDPIPWIIDSDGGQEQKAVLGATVDVKGNLYAIESSTGNLILRDGGVGGDWSIKVASAVTPYDSVLLMQEQNGIITCIHGTGNTIVTSNLYIDAGTKTSSAPIPNIQTTIQNDMSHGKFPSFSSGAKAF